MWPYQVVCETKGRESYVLEELDRSVLRISSVATFHLIPYAKQEHLDGWA